MMRNWRARRISAKASSAAGKAASASSATAASTGGGGAGRFVAANPSRRFYYPPQQMMAVTLVVDDATQDAGLVWGNRGPHVVLVKLPNDGFAKQHMHPHLLRTGLHLYAVNNQPVADAAHARVLCEQVLHGEPLTLLMWQPPTPGAMPSKKPLSTTTRTAGGTTSSPAPLRYLTATIYKEHVDSKTGLSLETIRPSRGGGRGGVCIARVAPPASHVQPRLHPGMRLLAVEQSTWFSHHSEAVPLIRSLPAGYCTFLLATDASNDTGGLVTQRSPSMDSTSVATTALMADEMSLPHDVSRRSHEAIPTTTLTTTTQSATISSSSSSDVASEDGEAATTESPHRRHPATPSPVVRLRTFTLTPEQAQQVILTETEEEEEHDGNEANSDKESDNHVPNSTITTTTSVVYVHASPVDALLPTGWQVVSVNDESLASAGHYEHFLQTTECDVTLCLRAPPLQADGDEDTGPVTATAYRPSMETKTGLVLTNAYYDDDDEYDDKTGGDAASGSNSNTRSHKNDVTPTRPRRRYVKIARVTPGSLFPSLQPGMRLISINGHDWFEDYRDAVGLIRSLTGEITVVAV